VISSRLAILFLCPILAGAILIAIGCDERRGEFDLAPKIIGTWEGPANGLTLRVEITADRSAHFTYRSEKVAFEHRATWQAKGPVLAFRRDEVREPIECIVSFPATDRMTWNQGGKQVTLMRK
jgi:hypothetical protein